MFYCPKCLNIYNISKSIKSKEQAGGATLDDIVKKILDNEEVDDYKFSEEDINELNNVPSFKKVNNKQKDYIYNYINEKINKKTAAEKTAPIKNMYFVCKNCGNSENVKEGTMILSKNISGNTNNLPNENINVKEYLQMNILPRTRQYNCPNEKCESHKLSDKKSAIFFRQQNTYKVRYICETCETSWNVS